MRATVSGEGAGLGVLQKTRGAGSGGERKTLADVEGRGRSSHVTAPSRPLLVPAGQSQAVRGSAGCVAACRLRLEPLASSAHGHAAVDGKGLAGDVGSGCGGVDRWGGQREGGKQDEQQAMGCSTGVPRTDAATLRQCGHVVTEGLGWNGRCMHYQQPAAWHGARAALSPGSRPRKRTRPATSSGWP